MEIAGLTVLRKRSAQSLLWVAADWIIETVDENGDLDPEKLYSVAILAHRASAMFGPVTIERLEQ